MKLICNNIYTTLRRFESFREFSIFINNQSINSLSLKTIGDAYYCLSIHDALTQEEIKRINFCSDKMEEDLNILLWHNARLLVIDTGVQVYFINSEYTVSASFEITTPLIGFYVTKNNNLLILEEATLQLVTSRGNILKNKAFDMIEKFSIKDDVLSIITCDETIVVPLS